MSETFDCLVLGLGGFGSGALYHLAKRGLRVAGIEQFAIAHDRGSSHGETRIIRKAYFEHPDYVPLLEEAYRLWRELETETGQDLFRETGLLLVGPAEGEAVSGSKLAATRYGVTIESLSASAAQARFSGFVFDGEDEVVFEPEAGYLRVEECVQAHLDRAQKLGAHLFLGETVRVWTDNGKQVSVRTDRGEYSANRLIVAAGPWSGNLLVDLKIPLAVVRKPLYWFPIKEGHADVYTQGPGFYFERGSDIFYGFPSIDGQTVKLAEHSGGEPVSDPGTLDRNSFERDERVLSAFVTDVLPGLDPQPVRHSVCMYTHTPDGHFIVDRHPEHENVVIGAGFSGHGFKFTSALGKALAEMAIDGKTAFPVGFLSLGRAGL